MYYYTLLEKHKGDIRKTWNIMNSVIGRVRDKLQSQIHLL